MHHQLNVIVMEQKVLDVMMSSFSEEAVSLLSNKFQEEESKARQAVIQAIPLVVNCLLTRGQREDGAETIWQLAHEAAAAGLPHEVQALSSTNWISRGTAIMESLLAEAYGMTLQRMAAATGVRTAAAEGILGGAVALTLGALGAYASQHQLQAPGLLAWLQWQEADIMHALPGFIRKPQAEPYLEKAMPGSALASTGVAPGSWTSVGGGMAYTPPAQAPQDLPRGSMRWQWGGIVLLAVGLGYFLGHDRLSALTNGNALTTASTASLMGGGEESRPAAPVATANTGVAAGHYDLESDTYIYDTGQPTILQLADGTVQKVGLNSTENRLYTFLADPGMQVDSVNRTKGWINCDRVYFDPGQATLTGDSQQQLRNIASILKTFPTAKVKFGGYTDSTGNALNNYKLSEERAKTAMLALGAMGVDINRVEAKGYGGKFFLTSNNSPEGRALNRRISVRVLKK
ncbi:OmpA family protein [Hymenobacter gelipurpurascens]|nr:OmpA family protein [Hymenobacter gelipurpurascens]